MLFAHFFILHLHVRESKGFASKEVSYVYVNQADVREKVLTLTGARLLPLFHKIELNLTTLYRRYSKFFHSHTATYYIEGVIGRRGQQLLVYSVIQIETDDGVSTRCKLQFITSQTVLSILCIIRIEHQCLRYSSTVMLHNNLDFLGIIQFLKFVYGSGTCFARRSFLDELELHITVCVVPSLIVIIRAACHYHGKRSYQEQQKCLAIFFEYLHYFLMLLNPILVIKTTRWQTPLASLKPAK